MPKRINYKYAPRKKRRVLRKIILSSVVLFVIGLIGGVFVLLGIMKQLPDPLAISELKIPQSTKIYDRTGAVLLYEIHGEEKRTVVPFNQISQRLKDATLVTEDLGFYSHSGVDFRSIVRAFFADVKSGELSQGGSTITQQLVKSTLLSSEKTFTRKIKEALLAIKIEEAYTKDEIFSFYLNQIPYGSNAYGAESAAQTFFGKSAKDLTLNEAATLAAMPQAPSHYSPYGEYKDDLIARKNYILDRMAEVGFATKDDAEKAKAKLLVFAKQNENILAPHFVMYVKNYLEETYGPSFMENAGLKVITTLDWGLQQKAEQIVTQVAQQNEKKYHASNAALVSVDPKTGQVLAMVGSRDYFDTEHGGNYNVATSKNRQPGSSFKPIAYAQFFKEGYPPETMLFDAKTEFSTDADPTKSYSPENYDGRFRGPISAQSALAQSINVPSVKVLYLSGLDNVVSLAHDLGITTLADRSKIGLSLVLGGGEVSPIDMVYAYSVFANDGVTNKKTSILKIEAADGSTVEEWRPQQKEVLDKNIARTITSILSNNDLRAPIFGNHSDLFFDGFDVAAKTGTTQNYKDAWVVGYTPDVAAAVWVGNNDATPMAKGGAGIAAAGPIFHQFMSEFLKRGEVNRFVLPDPIVSTKPMLDGNYITETKVKVDADSGKLATTYTPPQKAREKAFGEIHTILQYVDRSNPLGDPPQNPSNDPQYTNWEQGVQRWLSENPVFVIPKNTTPVEYDDIHTANNAPSVNITSPSAFSFVNDQTEVIASVSSHYPIREVDFYLDGVLFSSLLGPPFVASAPLSPLGLGSHGFLVRAYDAYDNVGSSSITVTK